MAYTNSGLVNYTKINPTCKNHPRTHVIDTITIHCYVAQATVEEMGAWLGSPTARASCNYGVAVDGKVYLCVDECDRSWCSSSETNDHRAITIETASNETDPYAVNDTAYKKLIELVADVCKRNGIPRLIWSTNPSDRIEHKNGCNMTVHKDFAKKECPGAYLYERMFDIASQVNAKLADPNYVPLPGSAVSASALGADGTMGGAAGSMGYIQIPINMEMIQDNLDYYIVTLDRFSKIPDIGKLMANRKRMQEDTQKVIDARHKWEEEHQTTKKVDGKTTTELTETFDEHAMLAELREKRKADKESGKLTDYDTLGFIVEAGYYFDTNHTKMNSYFNPRIKEMMAEIQKYEAPFGFFAVTRARTEQEARDELEQLRYVFANYTTDLGFWLVMDFPSGTSKDAIARNDAVLEVYRHYLVDYYGFVQKMGLYATAKQLEMISWPDIQKDWFLWLVDHVKNLDDFLHPKTDVAVGGGFGGGGITSVEGVFSIPSGTTSITADQWKNLNSKKYMCIATAKYLHSIGYQRTAIVGVVAYMLGEGRGIGFNTYQSYWLVGDPNGHTFPFTGTDGGNNIPMDHQCFNNNKWKAWLNGPKAWQVDPNYGSISVGIMSQTDNFPSGPNGPRNLHLATDFVNDAISKGHEWQSPIFQCEWVRKMTSKDGTYGYLGSFLSDPYTHVGSASEWCQRYTGMFAHGSATMDGRYLSSLGTAESYVKEAIGS